jgi:hypothetical protein
MSAMPRYLFPDDYTLAELQRNYQMSDTKGRIELLKNLHDQVPCKLELMAVEDPDVQVRQWIARYGKNLEYASYLHRGEDGWVHEKLKPSLYERLKSDGDPFVRSCLLENPGVTFWNPEDHFLEATHLERLALMRNPDMRLADRLLKKIFDHDDTELPIEKKQREELILAFLTNDAAVTFLEEHAGLSEHSKPNYRSSVDAESLLSDLWGLAARWPTDKLPAPVPELTYQYLPASDKTKAKAYEQCHAPLLRKVILQNCGKKDLETLRLGVKDADDDVASIARSIVYRFDLSNLLEADSEEQKETNRINRIVKRFTSWRDKNELLWVGMCILLVIAVVFFGMFFTEEGPRVLAARGESRARGGRIWW